MKKITLLLGCLFMFMASAVSAQDVPELTTKTYPPAAPVLDAAQRPAKAPLNQEAAKGMKVYMSTASVDYNRQPGIIKFYTGNPYEWEKVGICREDDAYQIRRFIGASYCTSPELGGRYVGYMIDQYSYTNYVSSFGAWNLETGAYEVLRDMSELTENFDYVEGSATNPVDGKLYGVAHDPENYESGVRSTIGTIDTATGEYTLVANLDWYYYDIDFDLRGNLWAVRWSSDSQGNVAGAKLVQIDTQTWKEKYEVSIKRNGADFIAYYVNSNAISFNRTTGELYAMLTDQYGYTYFARLNRNTGDMEDSFYSYNSGSGLYLPFLEADNLDAAGQVAGLTSALVEQGTKVTLSWNNPAKTWGGDELSALAEVMVYRDNMESDPVAVVEATGVGQAQEWTDDNAPEGVHTYIVVPCRVAGEKGLPSSWEVFIGEDKPGVVENVVLVKESDSKLTLSWDAPSKGDSDGWYDASTLTYKVVRYPDAKVMAEATTETSLTDETLGEINSYYYEVTASTAKGTGAAAQSNSILAGNAYAVPYTADYTTAEKAAAWTAVDNNFDGKAFTYSDYNQGYILYTESYNESDDYVISPKVDLQGGTTYKITFDVYFSYINSDYYPDTMHDFDITAGTGVTAAEQNVVVESFRGYKNFVYYSTHTVEGYFTPEADGDYNFAIHWLTKFVSDNIVIKGARIEKVFDNDLKAQAIEGPKSVVEGAEADYDVTVYNAGGKDVAGYTVKVLRVDEAGDVVLGQTEVTEPLASLTDTKVKVTAVPDVKGAAQFYALVELEGDENKSNDTTAALDVEVEDGSLCPFNEQLLKTDYNTDVRETRRPISMTDYYFISEAIYHPEDFQTPLNGGVSISRLALTYSSNDGGTITELPVKVYLGQTTKDDFYAESWGSSVQPEEWIHPDDMQLVYDGLMTTVVGEDCKLVFNFDQNFEYDPSKNLVVCFMKEGDCGTYSNGNMFPVLYRNYESCDPYGEEIIYRYLGYESDRKEFDFASTRYVSASYLLPVVDLAVSTATGIADVTVGGRGVAYDKKTGAMVLSGLDAKDITVYNLSGQAVRQVSAQHNRSLNLANGIYIVKVTTAEGQVYTTKIQVK